MKIWLAILDDRHFDMLIVPCGTADAARRKVEVWKQVEIDHGGEWKETVIQGWLYYASAGDDGPKVRIECKDLVM